MSVAVVARLRMAARPKCSAASVDTEKLRSQLDQLHAEAESTRAKANGARFRLMRLSEAAENLRRQAVINVQTGKENDARELLFQKKKVVQALEKAKARIELLDQLSSKLNEAISFKETQLIGNIAMDLEVNQHNHSSPVHIVSPKHELVEDEKIKDEAPKFSDNENSQLNVDSQESLLLDKNIEDLQACLDIGSSEEDSIMSSLTEVSSYEEFLEHLDGQLSKMETELLTILSVSAFVLNHEEKPKNLKVLQTTQLLESIRGVRQRIASIMHKETTIS